MRKSFDYYYKGAPKPIKSYSFGRVKIEFPTFVDNYAIYDNKIIVKLFPEDLEKIYPKENSARNIWCYRDDGTLLWKIEESPDWLKWLERQSPEEKQRIFAKGHKDYYTGVIYYKGLLKGTRQKKLQLLGFNCKIRGWENYEETGEWLWARVLTGVS